MTLIPVSEIDEEYRYVVSEDVLAELRRLLRAVPATEGTSLHSEREKRMHSILELEGLGREIWEGVDPIEYIKELRSEWDDR